MSRYYYSERSSNSGIGVFTVLQIVFIVLKLCDLIDWSWWYVFMPTFVSVGIWLIFMLILLGVRIWDAVKN